MAPLLVLSTSPALLAVGPMVSVEAPWRMLIRGQSISCAVGAPATGCCEFAVGLEKKLSILSRVELDDVELDEDPGGAVVEVDGGLVRLLPEHPASINASKPATGKRPPERIR